jgi:Na+-driven multidrug efflux pump
MQKNGNYFIHEGGNVVMSRNEAVGERELGTKNVKSLLVKYSIAALIGQSLQMCQITGDGFFVGNGIGQIGLATISIVYPLLVFTLATGSLIGIGATSISAIHLGKGEVEEARSYFGQSIVFSVILSLIIMIFGLLNVESIVTFLGASGELVKSASSYASVFFYSFPFTVTGCVFYFYVRLDEQPFIGTLALTVPALVAIIVEYFCIFKWHLGIASSAISFGLCVGSWSLIGIYFIISRKTIFKMKPIDFRLDFRKILGINKTGSASFIIQVVFAVVAIVINNLLGIYGGPLDIAAFGIINAYLLYIFSIFVTLGFTLGLQPIVSFNYGARKFARVREAMTVCIKYTIGTMAVLTALLFVFAHQVVSFFAGDAPELIAATQADMKIYLLLFALGGISFLVSGYYQAIEHNGKAILNGCTRNIIFIIPLLFILPKFLGVTGIWAAQPIADVLSFAVAMFLVNKEIKRLKQLENESIEDVTDEYETSPAN